MTPEEMKKAMASQGIDAARWRWLMANWRKLALSMIDWNNPDAFQAYVDNAMKSDKVESIINDQHDKGTL